MGIKMQSSSSRAIFLWILLCSVCFANSMNWEASGDGDFTNIPKRNFTIPDREARTPIYFSFITDSNGSALKVNSSNSLAARLAFTVNRALAYINLNFSNYVLRYTTALDSQCDRTTSLNMFFKHFQSPSQPVYLSSLCCGCSTATIPVAEISHHWNIPQISFSAGAEELTDRSRFESFFRTIPSFKYIAPALTAIMHEFHWTQMVVIHQDDPSFNMIAEGVEESFELNDWNLQVKSTSEGDIFDWDRDYRIVFVGAYIDTTLDILCEAAHRSEFNASNLVWITMAWSVGWWETSTNSSCPPQLMQTIAKNSLLIIPDGFLVVDVLDRIPFNLSADDLAWLEEASQIPFIFPPGAVYDAVMTLAMGLMEAAERISRNDTSGCESVPGNLVPLEMFSYYNEKMGCILHQSIANLSFEGVTGLVQFNENGSRINDNQIALLQHQVVDNQDVSGEALEALRVANIIVSHNETSFDYVDGENASTIWPDGIPYDGSPVQEVDTHHLGLVIVYSLLASAGLIYAALCVAFNIVFRNRLVVKLSSPHINYLIVVGSSVMYINVYLLVAPSTDLAVETVICNVQMWLFFLGYTLCIAVFLAKTWRVYYIFTNPVAKKKKVLIKDWVLFSIVGVIVGAQLIILTVGTAVIQPTANLTEDEDHLHEMNSEGINVENLVVTCLSTDGLSQTIWILSSLAYMFLLEMVAVFMAFHTRKVKLKAINDSKEIAALVYINSIILIVITIVLLTLSGHHEVSTVVLGLCIILTATLFLSLVFVPTAVRLYHDPDGERALRSTTFNTTSDKNAVTRSLSVTESPMINRGMSFTYRPSMTKMSLPTLKEDVEEGKAKVDLSEKVGHTNSVDTELNLEEKKNGVDGKTATNASHDRKIESQL